MSRQEHKIKPIPDTTNDYYLRVFSQDMCAHITNGTPSSILTLGDTPHSSYSLAEHFANRYSMHLMHSSSAREGSLRHVTPRIIQSSIESLPTSSTTPLTSEPLVSYHQDDNRTTSNIKDYSEGGNGYDLIVGDKQLCYCDLENAEEIKASPACGGIEHTPEAVKSFFITKLVANFKDERSVAYITGGTLPTQERLYKTKLSYLLNPYFSSLPREKIIPLSPTKDIIMLPITECMRLDREAKVIATKVRACYLDGLECVKGGIRLFNSSPDARGYQAELTVNSRRDKDTPVDFPGYTVTVRRPKAP